MANKRLLSTLEEKIYKSVVTAEVEKLFKLSRYLEEKQAECGYKPDVKEYYSTKACGWNKEKT